MSEPNLDRQQSVFDLLQQFQGSEPLKKLFWSELNYDRENRALSRRGWTEAVAGALAGDPVLLASGAGDFHVIYSRLASDKLLMGQERPVVSKLLHDHPYGLFIFSNSKQDEFHFLNVKFDDDVQKRRLFRRITVGPNERLRTASERIAMLDLSDIRPDLFGLKPLTIQHRHDEAFDVEPVTKEFFSEYRRIFEEVEEAITGFGRDKERKRLYTQRLFNRLMFIAFIQKKGWLKINGDADYLAALWKAQVKDNTLSDKNFYRDRLKPLFFFGLNGANEIDLVNSNRGVFMKTLIGDVPYLNGGLFEEDADDKNEDIKVPDKAVNAVINGLFAKFNFTVTESTPLDVEVAVDPEMLGKIFEELVTGRHETGSYYTPKPIVSFMCREALKGYLETKAPREAKDAIERFVDKHEPNDLRNAESVLDALREVKVCDPACGSGAYLLGVLHELLDLRAALFQNRKLDAKSVYDRKLEIIQSSIYGVDIDPFAVNIARLRLWLSLAVDFEGAKPEPLPNLDYKVEVGDSLLGPSPSGGLELGFRKQLIDEFLRLKSAYLRAHHAEKRSLKQQVEKAKADIRSFSSHVAGNGFDWAIEFAEIFVDGSGFDIAVANPPYVRMELFKDIKPTLKKNFSSIHSDRTDLYCYFYARAVEILRENGVLSFISSGKWLRSGYGAKLRTYLGRTTEVSCIIDFGDLPVFQAASAYPSIFLAKKHSPSQSGQCLFAEVQSLEEPYPDVNALLAKYGWEIPLTKLSGDNWDLQKQRTVAVQSRGVTLREYVDGRIFYGVKTGLNEAFVIDSDTRSVLIREDRRCSKFIKPLISGRDIKRWKTTASGKWLIYLPHGVDVRDAGPILRHLKPFKQQLEDRATKQEWYELQQPQYRYTREFDQPKLVYQVFQVKPCFALDNDCSFVSNSVYVIPKNDLFLLAVLNSTPFWDEVARCCSKIQNGYQLMLTYFERVIIPLANEKEKQALAQLASRCVENGSSPPKDIELQIDKRVAALYGRS